ncbi:MAG: histidine kinase [Bacteroidetes bacterium]|nr:MAG: histidine kinase [Bacteroidota bacterium]
MEAPGEMNILAMLLPLAGLVFIIAIGVVLLNQQFQKNLYRQQLEQEELKNAHQRELLISSIRVQEEERKRIAQDLHDELGATLSIARMHLVQLQKKSGDEPGNSSATLDNIKSLVEYAMANMRRISHELMPPQLEAFGLVEALDAVALQVNNAGEIHIDVNATPDFPDLDWLVKLGLYRINMELINNTIKHAGAGNIIIDLACEAGIVISDYRDNGKGLPENFTGKGLGYKGMEGRVASLGGSLETGNNPEGGFFARIKIPLQIHSEQ